MTDNLFDRSKLKLKPLQDRVHDLDLDSVLPLTHVEGGHPSLKKVAEKMLLAREKGASVILMGGGHVIRSGVQRYIIDLMEKGLINCLALNGAGVIHDYELALIGATTESVERYVSEGQFGLWSELSAINDIVSAGAKENLGLGEAVGRAILKGDFPNKDISLLAAGARLGIPVTIHVGIGYDILHELPNCDGAAYGAASYIDFLRFARCVQGLSEGVIMNFGSAVMAPEVFLKALSMARNIAHQEGRKISLFTALVCDLAPIPEDIGKEPPRTDFAYYFRPLKTMLIRTIKDGGEGFYVQRRHSETIPELWSNTASLNGRQVQRSDDLE